MRTAWVMVGMLALIACDDDERHDGSVPIDARLDGLPDVGPPPAGATHFLVRIENVAGPAFPTALGAGAWVLHADPDPLFTEGAPDRGLGLEALAEDGDPTRLRLEHGGTFPATEPGAVTDIIVTARPERPRLSFATMLVESNDVFLAPAGEGIPLFDANGQPLVARDVTRELLLWNLGTEADQAPGLGPDQAARQPAPGTGGREGVPRPFTDSTRTLPLARDLVEVSVTQSGGVFTVTVRNVAPERRLFVTELSPVVWVVHGTSFALFEPGAPASAALEQLAEDARAEALVRAAAGAPGVLVVDTNGERLGAGDTVTFTVRPDAAHPLLTLATGLPETNDAFIAMRGVRLVDANGTPLPAETIGLAIARALTVWDAGTEANEAPGVGANQAQRQSTAGAGAPDPIAHVRRYDDATNDLAGLGGGGYAAVSIRRVTGTTFDVRITNTSGSTPNPGLISPTAWAIHDGSVVLLGDTRVTRGMEALAEDCHAGPLADELRGLPGVRESEPLFVPDGATEPGPLFDGDTYSARVTADATHRWLAFITMPFPSNDALITLGTSGIALLDEAGRPRSDQDIARDIEATWRAWDGGTEANQAGAAGHDMSPLQESSNIGMPEGDGTVRREPDPIWSYPNPVELVRVSIIPLL